MGSFPLQQSGTRALSRCREQSPARPAASGRQGECDPGEADPAGAHKFWNVNHTTLGRPVRNSGTFHSQPRIHSSPNGIGLQRGEVNDFHLG